MKRPLAFFKFFAFGRNDKQMKIPIAFIAMIEQALPEKVYLRDRFNNIWTVKIAKIGDDFYFSDGWIKFVKDNRMTTCDVLVFEYLNDGLFRFKLFGPCATEKHLVSPVMVKGIEQQEFVSKDDDGVGDDYGDDVDDDDEMENEHCEYVFRRRLDNDDDNDNDDDDDDDEEETHEDGNHVTMRHGENKGKEVVREQVHDDEAVVGRGNAAGGPSVKFNSKRYAMEIFKAGLAPEPKNPYFVTRALHKRKTDLFIPKSIIRDYNLDLSQEIWLVDPRQKEFPGKCKKWKGGRTMISGGWSRLCKVNFVDDDDICLCEFVQEPNRRLSIKITFLRPDGFEPIIRS